MNLICLDVHSQKTQLSVCGADGSILLEKIVNTTPEELRRAISNIAGPKRVVFENGPLSGLVWDALKDVVAELVACDPTRNRLIAEAEDSNDLRDARRLGVLDRAGALHAVYVPKEPFRTLRSVVSHEVRLTRLIVEWMIKVKALCRKYGIKYRGKGIYRKENRARVYEQIPTAGGHFQMESSFRILDTLRLERITTRSQLREMTHSMPLYRRLLTVPGIGPIVARTLMAWIVDPKRFKKRSALNAYCGLGLRQNYTSWKLTGKPMASRKGQRAVKRVIFLAARAAIHGENAFKKRYQARIGLGWQDQKAIRDIARTLLFVACHVWRTGEVYDDGRIRVPNGQGPR